MREPNATEEGVTIPDGGEPTENDADGEEPAIDLDEDTFEEIEPEQHHLVRWAYTNDLVGSLLLLSYPAILAGDALGILDLDAVPLIVLLGWITLAGVPLVWMFGIEAAESWLELKNKIQQ